jgi:hypothetical protein
MIKTEFEIKHYGSVRGGCNTSARLHLSICPAEGGKMPAEEAKAIFSVWDEEFGIVGSQWVGWDYKINSRREFALVPAIIRKAQRIGYDMRISMWDVGPCGEVSLKKDPATFWQSIALAQMWFEK